MAESNSIIEIAAELRANSLAPRNEAIMAALASGRTRAEIAERFNVSIPTSDRVAHENRGSRPASGWTEERIELLKKCHAEGLSASQSAARIGGVTRNACIGKLHRLGLTGRRKVTVRKNYTKRA